MTPNLTGFWRISTFRLAVTFGLCFTLCVVALLGLIYWQTSTYLTQRVDRTVESMRERFGPIAPPQLYAKIDAAIANDIRKVDIYAVFTSNGTRIAGNLRIPPPELLADGHIHSCTIRESFEENIPSAQTNWKDRTLARAIAMPLPDGHTLVLGRDITQLDEIRLILMNALLVSGAVILVLGLGGGIVLSIHPLRRIQAIRDLSQNIIVGDLSLRMPVSPRNDELDMLTATVNVVLDEMEKLLNEVKSATDSLAHDLRTPLTRLRLTLYRSQQQSTPGTPQYDVLENALAETDDLLRRFRALLRISEIESRRRRAGFSMIEPAAVVMQVADLYGALADEKGVVLKMEMQTTGPIQADAELLFEAVSNLVENAIKFTDAGGTVTVRVAQDGVAPVIEVIDTGCGIDPEERDAVLQRFYRSKRVREKTAGTTEGYGLGLSCVAAIVRLHGFTLKFRDVPTGTHLTIDCATSR